MNVKAQQDVEKVFSVSLRAERGNLILKEIK